ncbi:diguanylate cyclase (plasmid) [Deinococcus taeanensis]|uniref:HD domain-containing phosphohydrolase n=1 Tax=Deinococcus taeanensis TaxID=2737050 RepID=UPI001CDB9645|nr:HD domain-containing phosphohydrolase [Deinococcus taeanensis]UBV45213.1 diguanylate cyclase [Deinococcus taeanensis]
MDSPELDRQHALSRYSLSDAADREALERITRLTTESLGIPSAQINVISEHHQHTWAHTRWPGDDLPRELSFCSHTILLPEQDILEIPDTWADARFAQHPLVTEPPHLRYYAGAPLRTPDGYAIGSLCLLDSEQHDPLSEHQQVMLAQFADLVMGELERQRGVRELREAFEIQHAQEVRLHALMDHASDLIMIKDTQHRFVDINRAAEAALGKARDDLIGQDDRRFFDEELYASVRASDELVMRTRQHMLHERRAVIQGRERVYESSRFPLILPDGAVNGVIVIARDVTERHELEQALRDANTHLEQRVQERTRALETLAYRDPLTSLSNRRAFDLAFDTGLVWADEARQPVHLLLFDLDELKDMNAQFGFARGDELLNVFASSLSQVFHDGQVFRLGGDEFTVLIQGEPRAPLAELTAQAVQLTRAAGFQLMTASVGTATYPTDAQATGGLLRLADQRMLRDKTARRSARNLGVTPAEAARAVEHPGAAVQAVRSTLKFLTQQQGLTSAAWNGLLEAAVASVPGAEAGSLTLREGDTFRYQAQVGHSDALLGVEQTVVQAQAWHSGPEWAQGRARILRGQDTLLAHSRRVVPHPESRAIYEQQAALLELRANLSVPVELSGEVVAEIHLDNLHREDAFDHHSVMLAEEFASLAAALISDGRRRAHEAARQRELEVLVRLSQDLRVAHTLEDVESALCLEAVKLLGTDHVVYLRFDAEEDALHLTARGWPYEVTPHTAPRGDGELWLALLTRSSLQLEGNVDNAALFRLKQATLLVTPLHAGERQMGVLVAARPIGVTFADSEMQLMNAVASSGVTAIQRVWAEQGNAERVRELQVLVDVARHKGPLDQEDVVTRRCLMDGREFLNADYAAYLHLESGTLIEDRTAPATFHAALKRLLPSLEQLSQDLGLESGSLAVANYPHAPGALPSLVAAGVQAVVSAPVLERGRAVGLVGFVWFKPRRALPSGAQSLTGRVAELIGRAVERNAFIDDLKSTHEGALLALGLSLELRDFETHGHTERVVRLASEVASKLGMNHSECDALRQGAYLHDVGKLAIPDAVLLKPGKLDAAEWALMQTHSAVGADMIARIPTIPTTARHVIRHHHERWDGTGYPDRLAGEEIPLAARLFSLVDVYDALTSARPYKKAWAPEEAAAELRAQAGRQFDPALVEVFLSVTP